MFQILTPLDNFHLRLIDVYIFHHMLPSSRSSRIYTMLRAVLFCSFPGLSSKVMISVLKDIHKAFINLPEAPKTFSENSHIVSGKKLPGRDCTASKQRFL